MDVHDRLHDIEKRLSQLEKRIDDKQEEEYRKYLAASQSKKTLDAIFALEKYPEVPPRSNSTVLPKMRLMPLWNMLPRK